MKVAIYSPYLDTLGGGERYMMTIAQVLSKTNQVDILLDSHLFLMDMQRLMQNLSDRFGLDLTKINLVRAPLGKDSNALSRAIFLTKYDLLVYLTDGSIFYPTSTKNILHIQSPIIGQAYKSIFGKLKLSGWDLIIYNSKFTQTNAKKYWPLQSEVVYPPVDIGNLKPLKKKKYILSVGRFSSFLKDKKHEILIETFKKMHKDNNLEGWSLNLAGSLSGGDKQYLETLKEESKGFPINFFPNLGYSELIKLYGESLIYWHASGYGEDDPTKMEHFGISTVEAMTAGCVPVVIGKGGQMEIVNDGEDGFLWNNLSELENKTLKLIKNEKLLAKFSRKSIKKASGFSKKIFEERIIQLSSD